MSLRKIIAKGSGNIWRESDGSLHIFTINIIWLQAPLILKVLPLYTETRQILLNEFPCPRVKLLPNPPSKKKGKAKKLYLS